MIKKITAFLILILSPSFVFAGEVEVWGDISHAALPDSYNHGANPPPKVGSIEIVCGNYSASTAPTSGKYTIKISDFRLIFKEK